MLVIILVMVGLAIGIVRYSYTWGYTCRARAEIATMASALESYKLDTGAYPPSGIANVYTALAGGPRKYMTFRSDQLSGTTILDPFTKPYNYNKPGTHNPMSFDLWSNGPDTVSDTADDIANWR